MTQNLLQLNNGKSEVIICFCFSINAEVKDSFLQLRITSKIKPFLSFKDHELVIQAFIASCRDYCNSPYTNITHHRLQLVQNVTAKLFTSTQRRDDIRPVLVSPHWLPINPKIDFKVLQFVYKALNDLTPSYITDL